MGTPNDEPLTEIPDPDATSRARFRWGVGEWGFGLGGLAFLSALPAWLLTDGLAVPLLVAAVVAVAIGSLLQRNLDAPSVPVTDLEVDASEGADDHGQQRRLRVHDDAVQRLLSLVTALDRASTPADLDDVLHAGRRVAHLVAVDLASAAEDLRGLIEEGREEDGRHATQSRLDQAHARAGEGLDELGELVSLLEIPEAEGQARQAKAVQELAAMNDWLRLRRQAMESLAGTSPDVIQPDADEDRPRRGRAAEG